MKKYSKLFDSIASIALISVVAMSVNAQVGSPPEERFVKKCLAGVFTDPNGGTHWFPSWTCSLFEDCVIIPVENDAGEVVGYQSGCSPTPV